MTADRTLKGTSGTAKNELIVRVDHPSALADNASQQGCGEILPAHGTIVDPTVT
jgi:hypothetical protein